MMSDGIPKKDSFKRPKYAHWVPKIEVCDMCGCEGLPGSLVVCRNAERGYYPKFTSIRL